MRRTPILAGSLLSHPRRPMGWHRVTWNGSFASKGKVLLTSSFPQWLARKELQTILELEKRGLKWRAIWSPGSQSKLISNLRQREKEVMDSCGVMLPALTSQESCKQSVPLHAHTGTGLALDHDAPTRTHPLWVQGLELPARRRW